MTDHPVQLPDDYHERLARYWPQPREQLHFGGWAATRNMLRYLELDRAEHALDICCGEGATARWLAAEYGRRVTGVDLLEKAILYARRQAEEQGLADLVSYEVSDLFTLPFPDATFDVIYGQDPDGLAHHQREDIFHECWRVLQPGGRIGFQLWLLMPGVPSDVKARFEQVSADVGYGWMRDFTLTDFLRDMEAAGLMPIAVDNMSPIYAHHMEAMEANAIKAGAGGLDPWNATLLKVIRDGGKVGARLTARKE